MCFSRWSFPYTSCTGFNIWGVSLTHHVLAFILTAEFLLHIPCWLHFYRISLTHPAGCGEFVLHIPSCFISMWGVSLTHPVLVVVVFLFCFLCEELLSSAVYSEDNPLKKKKKKKKKKSCGKAVPGKKCEKVTNQRRKP